jgi:hypothetical protein
MAKSKSTKQPKQDPKATPKTQKQPPPNWPPLQPLLPSDSLTLDTLLPSQILTISNLWTSTLCAKYVAFLKTLPLATTPGIPKKGDAVRVNDRFQIEDPGFAERLWSETGLKDVVEGVEDAVGVWGGEVIGLNSNIRVYRYGKGQFFDQHCEFCCCVMDFGLTCRTCRFLILFHFFPDDDSNNIQFPSASSPNAVPAKTTWTLLLYLTSPVTGCHGGETVFFPDAPSRREAPPPPIVADLEVGKALLHRHGRDCMLHEGREVTEGEKWIIRSDLCVKR